MQGKKKDRKRFSEMRTEYYKAESAKELFPSPPGDLPGAPCRPSEDPGAEFIGYLFPDEERRLYEKPDDEK